MRRASTKDSHLIGIAGAIGSGKSTLAAGLAAELGWATVQEPPLGLRYLTDLQRDPARWAFETQVAFLARKAVELRRHLLNSSPVILDRTLAEDRDVFTAHFHSKGFLDSRAMEAYEAVFAASAHLVPAPSVLIICVVSLDTAIKRVLQSPGSRAAIDREFISDIHNRYALWTIRHPAASTLVLDSESLDWRSRAVASEVAKQVRHVLASHMKRI